MCERVYTALGVRVYVRACVRVNVRIPFSEHAKLKKKTENTLDKKSTKNRANFPIFGRKFFLEKNLRLCEFRFFETTHKKKGGKRREGFIYTYLMISAFVRWDERISEYGIFFLRENFREIVKPKLFFRFSPPLVPRSLEFSGFR